MPDRRITFATVGARDDLNELARLAHEADTERDELITAVRRIGTVLTDPSADDHQKVDQAVRTVNQTIRAWEARHG